MKGRMGAQTSRSGFTIVELLIVIVVIAILAAITIVAYNGIQNQAKASAAQAAAKQALTKIQTYAVQNADQYPANLSAAGLANSGNTTYQYRVDNSANPKTFCITATTDDRSYYVSSTTGSPAAGACSGHAVDGGEVITNLARDPRATGLGSGEMAGRYGTGVSNVNGVSDGPSAVPSSYFRQTIITTVNGAGRGFDLRGNLDTSSAPADTAWPVTSGSPVNISLYVRASVSNPNTYLECRVHDASGTWLTGRSGPATTIAYTANSWRRLSIAYTPAATGYLSCTVRFQDTVTWSAGATMDATGLMITQGSSLPAYADGNSPGWIWNGAPNNSTSTGPPL